MKLYEAARTLNGYLLRKDQIAIVDLQNNPLKYVEILTLIREELGDQATFAQDKAIKEAIAILIHFNATKLRAALKEHRKLWFKELIRRLSK